MKKEFIFLVVIAVTTLAQAQWFEQEPKVRTVILESITFSNQFNGAIVGSKGTILHSSDAGESWDSLYSPTNADLEKVFFIDDFNGWIVGDSGKVLYSSDGGLNWSILPNVINEKLFSVHFINSSTGFIVGNNVIYKTTNSGNSWQEKKREINSWYYDVYFSNQLNGWVVGDSAATGVILKTSDGGETWTTIYQTYFGYLSDICFASPSVAYVSGENSIVPKSTDGGSTWFDIVVPHGPFDWQDVFFIDEYKGWLVDIFGTVANTTDGGSTWDEQIPGGITQSEYLSIYFVDSLIGWAVGAGFDPELYGKIIKTTNGGVTEVEDDKNLIVDEFKLSQNYPNPFNPTTTIRFTIPQSPLLGGDGRGGLVTLKVYDVLGIEITTLVNEEKPSGSYEVEFNASSLPSGVYFYQLKAGDFIQTIKMVLIK